ncbi:MAG: hypothetical protein GX556_14760 [Fibrobacter sp.]|nr:hypothetical protein [Fibrobacter sp.]
MNTIAITNWNNIVSPHYDASCCFLIISPDCMRKCIDVRSLSLIDKAELCIEEGVKVMICGAISSIGCATLEDRGINVISWVRGSVDDVIIAYQNNIDFNEKFTMPGYTRRGCCKRGQFRRRQCGHLPKTYKTD